MCQKTGELMAVATFAWSSGRDEELEGVYRTLEGTASLHTVVLDQNVILLCVDLTYLCPIKSRLLQQYVHV
ncbi:hypothetical protein GDO86_015278 [Hymenochirus boettgeri]|uniref:Uncharacterized protein n=1 Tax=Hymenochirus boettgeri TaxID=247094 RepID=A0A8T2JXL1_9PIPI|nr:hypothetical protein GDO86_015278 [Hymenochirus boettgeri]